MIFCEKCNNKVPYIVKKRPIDIEVNGIKLSYIEVSAHCPFCDVELYVPWVNDVNASARKQAYIRANVI